ncbi:stealth family protein [Brevibacterium sp.]|uniref:stealth family protein n=1 Tax=Brevibacterium sp. TaxID=1701 RepID=UPI002811BD6B|nr:stealth family protein [Brevibacterium sp.]
MFTTLLAPVRGTVASRLSVRQKLLVSKLRHGELDWQEYAKQSVVALPGRAKFECEPADSIHVSQSATEENLRRIRQKLSDAGIEFVELPRRGLDCPLLVVPRSRMRTTLSALDRLPAARGWERSFEDTRLGRISERQAARKFDEIARVRCRRRVDAPNGRELSSPCEDIIVEFWDHLGPREQRVDGSTHVSGTLHRRVRNPRILVEYLTPGMWDDAVRNRDRKVEFEAPDIYSVRGPVDVVYTWVDGSDVAWKKRQLSARGMTDEAQLNATALSASRFTNRNELMYSLRSLESYASWVNHVFIVTDQQVPEWLDTSNPKVTIVDHREIFRDPTHLPVFNSHAIESQLHHIEGLSEHYLYMNDDLFFMRPTSPELFFTGNGMSKFFPSTAPLDVAEPSARDLPVLSAAKHGREFILTTHGRTVSHKFKHTPHPQLRSVLSEMERNNPELFDAVSASKFRHPDDYSIASSLYHFHAYAEGRAIDAGIRYAYMDIARQDAALYLHRLARRRDLDVLCLNDTDFGNGDPEALTAQLTEFLEDRFPFPSSFEKN